MNKRYVTTISVEWGEILGGGNAPEMVYEIIQSSICEKLDYGRKVKITAAHTKYAETITHVEADDEQTD